MKITYSKQFIKSFESLERKLQVRIRTTIAKLPDGKFKKLKGNYKPQLYRLRVGKYRIIFEMSEQLIRMIDVDSRGDIYKNI